MSAALSLSPASLLRSGCLGGGAARGARTPGGAQRPSEAPNPAPSRCERARGCELTGAQTIARRPSPATTSRPERTGADRSRTEKSEEAPARASERELWWDSTKGEGRHFVAAFLRRCSSGRLLRDSESEREEDEDEEASERVSEQSGERGKERASEAARVLEIYDLLGSRTRRLCLIHCSPRLPRCAASQGSRRNLRSGGLCCLEPGTYVCLPRSPAFLGRCRN